jgi:hypothetical protein
MVLGEGSPLALDADTMRRLGYRTIDLLVDRITGPVGPVVRRATRRSCASGWGWHRPRLRRRSTRSWRAWSRMCSRLSDASAIGGIWHSSGTWPGALGHLIGSALNVDTCWWLGASGPRALEQARLAVARCHTPRVSEHVRIGLGVLGVAWFGPVLAWAFLALRSEIRADPPSVLFLVHRTLPALILLAAVFSESWAVVWAAVATGVVTSLTVAFVRQRWPESWDRMGETGS